MNFFKDVYLWNARALANELHGGTLSEYRALKHFLVSVIIGGSYFYFPVGIEFVEPGIGFSYFLFESVLFFIVTGVISYFGIWLCFQGNSKGDGKEFFLRMATLALPVLNKVLILGVFVGVPLLNFTVLILSWLFEGSSILTIYVPTIIEVILGFVFLTVYYIILHRYMCIAAGYDRKKIM